MEKKAISLMDLIRFFDDKASPRLLRRIEVKRRLDSAFNQEVKEWEQFISSFSSRKDGIDKMYEMYKQWQAPFQKKPLPLNV